MSPANWQEAGALGALIALGWALTQLAIVVVKWLLKRIEIKDDSLVEQAQNMMNMTERMVVAIEKSCEISDKVIEQNAELLAQSGALKVLIKEVYEFMQNLNGSLKHTVELRQGIVTEARKTNQRQRKAR